jgi:hypothetical protein
MYLPTDIQPSEKIARAIMSPHHFDKKNRLRPGAFRPAPGSDDVSVIRQTLMGSDFCKAKAKEFAADRPDTTYMGLVCITVEQIRSIGAQVSDSQNIYCGHAHISYGIIVERDEPQESEKNRILIEFTRSILRLASYYEDPEPEVRAWTGPALCLKDEAAI